jgi:hypothetical protein
MRIRATLLALLLTTTASVAVAQTTRPDPNRTTVAFGALQGGRPESTAAQVVYGERAKAAQVALIDVNADGRAEIALRFPRSDGRKCGEVPCHTTIISFADNKWSEVAAQSSANLALGPAVRGGVRAIYFDEEAWRWSPSFGYLPDVQTVGRRIEFKEKAPERILEIAKAMFGPAYEQAVQTGAMFEVYTAPADLGQNVKLTLVYVESPYFCGSIGCHVFGFVEENGALRPVLNIRSLETVALSTRVGGNGTRDLLATTSEGYIRFSWSDRELRRTDTSFHTEQTPGGR